MVSAGAGDSATLSCSCCCSEVESSASVDTVEEILGYRFRDRALVLEALTHPSFHWPVEEQCVSYERLEFLGDAALNCLVAKEFFCLYPELSPGSLTQLRAANVDTEKLARVAVQHGLHRYIRHKAPLLQQKIKEFVEAIEEFPIHSHGMVESPKQLADIVEALLGAIFQDTDYDLEKTWKVVKGFLEPVIHPSMLKRHPMTELLEFCQKRSLQLKFKRETSSRGGYQVSIFLQDCLIGTGCAQRREIAQNRAAKVTLDNLKTALVNAEAPDGYEKGLLESMAAITIQ